MNYGLLASLHHFAGVPCPQCSEDLSKAREAYIDRDLSACCILIVFRCGDHTAMGRIDQYDLQKIGLSAAEWKIADNEWIKTADLIARNKTKPTALPRRSRRAIG